MADTRQHWQMHASMIPANNASRGDDAWMHVFSAKNEGADGYVRLTSNLGPFDVGFSMTPESAERLADHLREAAAAARTADVSFGVSVTERVEGGA